MFLPGMVRPGCVSVRPIPDRARSLLAQALHHPVIDTQGCFHMATRWFWWPTLRRAAALPATSWP